MHETKQEQVGGNNKASMLLRQLKHNPPLQRLYRLFNKILPCTQKKLPLEELTWTTPTRFLQYPHLFSSLGRVRTYGFWPARWQRYKRWIDKAATQGPAEGWDEYITQTATGDLGQRGSRSRAPLTKSAASVTRRAKGGEGTEHVERERARENQRGRGFVLQSPLWDLATLEQGLQNWPTSRMQGLFTTRPHSIKSVSRDDVCECVCQPMASFIQQGRQKQAAASIDGPSSGPSADWGRRVSGRQQSGGKWKLGAVRCMTGHHKTKPRCVYVCTYKSKWLSFYYIVPLFL